MKFTAVFLLAFVATAYASPTSIKDNNIGDIVTVGVNANLQLENHVKQNLLSVLVALLNQQGILVGLPGRDGNDSPTPAEEPAALPDLESIVQSFLEK